MKEKIFKILHNRDRMPGERFGDIEGKIEEFINQEVEKRIAERMPSEGCYSKEFVIAFTDWLDKLQPCQRVSVWSKNGEYNGLFTMDNEQLLERFKKIVCKNPLTSSEKPSNQKTEGGGECTARNVAKKW